MTLGYWLVIPAAGSGRRMGMSTPKQYLPLLHRTVIEWAIAPFLNDARCRAVVVALASDDAVWNTLAVARDPRIRVALGGVERAHSVQAGLHLLAHEAQPDDWVLVHDAARPCLLNSDLDKLIAELAGSDEPTGGLLATPLADTLKRADADRQVLSTVPRADLWRALTPQMFRYQLLRRALQQASDAGQTVTDEAAAIEALGFKPRLIAGRADNLKITVPEDLVLAASVLNAQRMIQ